MEVSLHGPSLGAWAHSVMQPKAVAYVSISLAFSYVEFESCKKLLATHSGLYTTQNAE